MAKLDCSTLINCRSSATLAISQLTSKWHAATGAAIFFGLLTLFILYHLLAKCTFRYRMFRNLEMADQINQTEMGSLSQEEPQHSGSSCEGAQLGIQRGPVGAETYYQQEGQQDLPSSTSTYRSQEMTPDVHRFDLVSCTQYGITLHSAQNPLSPLQPQRFHIPRTTRYGAPTSISHGPETHQATCASAVEHRSSLPKLVTASSAMASPTAGEMDNDSVARPFSLVEVTRDTSVNEEKPAEEPQKPRWPFFQDKCVLEEGMLTSLFDDSSWQ